MAKYRQKGNPEGAPFEVLTSRLEIKIDDLLAADDALAIIALRAVEATEDMMAIWTQYKDQIEPVEGK